MFAERIRQGIALEESGRVDEAIRIYEDIVGKEPGAADAWHRLGDIAVQRADMERAERFAQKAVRLKPQSPRYRTALGTIYAKLGRFDAAEAEYRRVVRVSPGFAHAYYHLSSIARFQKDDDLVGMMLSQLKNGSIKDRNRSLFHFSVAKYYDQTDDPDRAFDHYRSGNSMWKAQFSPQDFWYRIQARIQVFDADFFARRAGQGSGSQMPVFVVGMPRSGTSLVEQIIASHPRIHGAGELPDIASIAGTIPKHAPGGQPYPDCMAATPDWVVGGFADAYLDRLRSLAPAALRVVNKTMTNYLNLGLIALLFPKARVIHCRRDPLDTCLSCYFQVFDGGFHDYSCDLWHLGFVYRCYDRLMSHWSAVLPIEIFEFQYEDLVRDQESRMRDLVGYCGVDWDPACAAFHRSERPVLTTSLRQVRQPLYKGSVGRWRRYERHLAPLFEALGPLAARQES